MSRNRRGVRKTAGSGCCFLVSFGTHAAKALISKKLNVRIAQCVSHKTMPFVMVRLKRHIRYRREFGLYVRGDAIGGIGKQLAVCRRSRHAERVHETARPVLAIAVNHSPSGKNQTGPDGSPGQF